MHRYPSIFFINFIVVLSVVTYLYLKNENKQKCMPVVIQQPMEEYDLVCVPRRAQTEGKPKFNIIVEITNSCSYAC